MVTEDCDAGRSNCRFVIRPNRSLSDRGALVFYSGISAVTLLVAAWFVSLGLWVVLPFAGLELLALGIALYLCLVRSTQCEVVSVRGDTVEVCKGRRSLQESRAFHRGWVQVTLEAPLHRWYPSRLILGSHGRKVEVGVFLTQEERVALAGALQRVILGNPASQPN
jgi:uncharacterized membrane protein